MRRVYDAQLIATTAMRRAALGEIGGSSAEAEAQKQKTKSTACTHRCHIHDTGEKSYSKMPRGPRGLKRMACEEFWMSDCEHRDAGAERQTFWGLILLVRQLFVVHARVAREEEAP